VSAPDFFLFFLNDQLDSLKQNRDQKSTSTLNFLI